MTTPWSGKRIVLGVTGGIAAYKSVQLARDLTRLGAQVDVVFTRSAHEFVRPLSFEGVTGRKVSSELFTTEGAALHIRLAVEADLVCVAPATADLIARAAHGRADDLLTTILLATEAPVLICPAMNDRMYRHPQTQANVAHLRDALGYRIAGPGVGPLAWGEGEGPGRMLEPAAIVEHVGRGLGGGGAFRGRRVLVTAGPTREPLDAVRYLGNRSSGKMGYALARAAWRRGAEVTLVTGPVSIEPPEGVDVVRVETAGEMCRAVREAIPAADITFFAAAVADFRPAAPHEGKMKRAEDAAPELALAANADIARETRPLRKKGSVAVGFALETSDLVRSATAKLEAKGFDLIAANDATEDGAGFDVDTNRITIVGRSADGGAAEPEALPLLSKDEAAERLLDRVATLLGRA
jgi:phosphopantothenoylcysteine decarboxylase / phosphopantothenate---cysteine ligase